ncbi:hypothetical protein cyc_00512 [Cyclospora cayetanensis]|uniref:DNA/RNA-binding protein Alba-like domain-containing protein n=1 Tax=Cyclospora cayetanensis TaxID=88456 RepID=A0A1D3D8J2_9EIME|nr:hypothetical protein cyc_00512 [Cyclospora cayetanensis]
MEFQSASLDGPSDAPCCTHSVSSSGSGTDDSLEAVLQSLPCGFLWIHRGSGGRLRKAADKTLQALQKEGTFCLVAKGVAANRCLSVAEIAKRHVVRHGGEVQIRCFFSGLGAEGEKRRESIHLFLLLGVTRQPSLTTNTGGLQVPLQQRQKA